MRIKRVLHFRSQVGFRLYFKDLSLKAIIMYPLCLFEPLEVRCAPASALNSKGDQTFQSVKKYDLFLDITN